MAAYTTIASRELPQGAAASLLFEKAHAYDAFPAHGPFETKTSRRGALAAVRAASHAASDRYEAWHSRFVEACGDLGSDQVVRATTQWRLIVGWSTNPALEGGGLTLHPNLGFPYLPGSAVKGVLRRLAEAEWAEWALRAGLQDPPAGGPPLARPPVSLRWVVDSAWRLRSIFGACVEQSRFLDAAGRPAWERLETWWRWTRERRRDLSPEWGTVHERLGVLVSGPHTAGALRSHDAVPDLTEFGRTSIPLLDLDVLTSHHKDYYAPGSEPHDREEPTPVHFLTVRPGVTFEFRFGVRLGTDARLTKAIRSDVDRWLVRGLMELGAGAKTAAGYGYFEVRGQRLGSADAEAPRVSDEPPAPSQPEQQPAPEALLLPAGLDTTGLANVLDKLMKDALEEPLRRAVARRALEVYGTTLTEWGNRPKPAIQRRVRWIHANAVQVGEP